MTIMYDPVLVLLSIGVAILGSLTALALTLGGYDASRGLLARGLRARQ